MLPKKANALFDLNKETLKNEPNYSLTIEFDAYTSRVRSLMAMVITTKSGDSTLFDLVDMSGEVHTVEYLKDIALNSLRKTVLSENKFNSIVSDEASNFKLARSLIINSLSQTHLVQYRCMAHTFDLIGASISKSSNVSAILQQTMKLVKHISSNRLACSKLKELGSDRIKMVVPSRWYSTSSCMKSILEAKENILRIRQLIYGVDK